MSTGLEAGSSKDDELDKPLTRRELIQILEPYNNSISALGSCMISVSTALRQSENRDVAAQGEIVFKKLDDVIEQLEKGVRQLDLLINPKDADQ